MLQDRLLQPTIPFLLQHPLTFNTPHLTFLNCLGYGLQKKENAFLCIGYTAPKPSMYALVSIKLSQATCHTLGAIPLVSYPSSHNLGPIP